MMLPFTVTQYCKNVLLTPDVKVNAQLSVARGLSGTAPNALCLSSVVDASCRLLLLAVPGVAAKVREQETSTALARTNFFMRVRAAINTALLLLVFENVFISRSFVCFLWPRGTAAGAVRFRTRACPTTRSHRAAGLFS